MERPLTEKESLVLLVIGQEPSKGTRFTDILNEEILGNKGLALMLSRFEDAGLLRKNEEGRYDITDTGRSALNLSLKQGASQDAAHPSTVDLKVLRPIMVRLFVGAAKIINGVSDLGIYYPDLYEMGAIAGELMTLVEETAQTYGLIKVKKGKRDIVAFLGEYKRPDWGTARFGDLPTVMDELLSAITDLEDLNFNGLKRFTAYLKKRIEDMQAAYESGKVDLDMKIEADRKLKDAVWGILDKANAEGKLGPKS